MTAVPDATEMLDREFLQIRSRLIDVAASLDRIAAREGSAAGDPRLTQIHRALELLAGGADADSPLAEAVQLIFSRAYRKEWRRELGV